jgi:CHRD domain.
LKTVGIAGVTLAGVGATTAAPQKQRNFRTHLSGDEVVPPVDTNAQGQVKFQLNNAGDELNFKLNVANIDDVIGAHIHQAPAGENGGIVVFLFGNPFTDPVTVNGTLAEGTITATDVIGLDFDALLTVMREGNTYVQVHTTTNPPGEIRGQIH